MGVRLTDVVPIDLRNDIAVARDKWMASEVGVECQAGMPVGIYLRNRLERAFCDGWEAAKASATSHNRPRDASR